MPDLTKLAAELTRDEKLCLKPYLDSVGKTTIGIGRNLTDRGISEDEATYLLANDIAEVLQELDRQLGWWRTMNEPRQRVLANMCFNMGIGTLMTFKNTLFNMREGNYTLAASGMRDSRWYTQVGVRAERLAVMMETGKEF